MIDIQLYQQEAKKQGADDLQIARFLSHIYKKIGKGREVLPAEDEYQLFLYKDEYTNNLDDESRMQEILDLLRKKEKSRLRQILDKVVAAIALKQGTVVYEWFRKNWDNLSDTQLFKWFIENSKGISDKFDDFLDWLHDKIDDLDL
jgi:hypothetical protein